MAKLGRMAYVAGVYNPPPVDWLSPPGPAPPLQARYLSGLYQLAEMGPLLRRQAAQVGRRRRSGAPNFSHLTQAKPRVVT